MATAWSPPRDDQIFYIIRFQSSTYGYSNPADPDKKFLCLFSDSDKAQQVIRARFLNAKIASIMWEDAVEIYPGTFFAILLDYIPNSPNATYIDFEGNTL